MESSGGVDGDVDEGEGGDEDWWVGRVVVVVFGVEGGFGGGEPVYDGLVDPAGFLDGGTGGGVEFLVGLAAARVEEPKESGRSGG